jgi:hypothetical protein
MVIFQRCRTVHILDGKKKFVVDAKYGVPVIFVLNDFLKL